MAQINKPNQYFNTKLYTGNGSNNTSITGVGFQPDWVWVKARNIDYGHKLFDAVRGQGKRLASQSTAAESTVTDELISFNSDGFTTNNNAGMNENTRPYVAWNWLANGAGSANTDGSITSTVSANTTSGFSIVSYTGNGIGSATIGHGLGVAPKVVMIKRRSGVDSFPVWLVGTTQYRVILNLTNASDTAYPISTSSTIITTPSTVDSHWNGSGSTYISYCFAEKKGYSKFGSYTGNGNADGTFVYLGFKPAFVMIKATGLVKNWLTFDNRRLGYNGAGTNKQLHPNTNGTESSGNGTTLDILSNGFKTRTTDSDENGSGNTYIYMAFAENPLVGTNNIPATAR